MVNSPSRAARMMCDDLRKHIEKNGGDNLTISAWNYGIEPSRLFMKAIDAHIPAGWTARSDGIMGYIAFRKAAPAVTPCKQCGGSGKRATAASANGRELERHERSGTPCDACGGERKSP